MQERPLLSTANAKGFLKCKSNLVNGKASLHGPLQPAVSKGLGLQVEFGHSGVHSTHMYRRAMNIGLASDTDVVMQCVQERSPAYLVVFENLFPAGSNRRDPS